MNGSGYFRSDSKTRTIARHVQRCTEKHNVVCRDSNSIALTQLKASVSTTNDRPSTSTAATPINHRPIWIDEFEVERRREKRETFSAAVAAIDNKPFFSRTMSLLLSHSAKMVAPYNDRSDTVIADNDRSDQ
ncbi:uncharacterized protein LOC112588196 [Harpegnathos saltator]|uniref:uncharacterized protein LOC112588196 n=1 Tax=Harpegnathos saltator TaxID=610380 RepID=UPI000DBECFCE|nr:uncharacterized protein LOC112588196 [Harpegnathos saltator]